METTKPPGIDIKRHADLAGRLHHPRWRRFALAVITAVPVIALFNVFGQRTLSSRADSPRASLLVKSPSHVRGGLIFTTEIVVTPHRKIRNAEIYFSNGWFKNMTFNAVSPQPSTDSAQGNWQIWDFGPLKAGQLFTVLISWQTNPTNVGSHPETIQLYDGKKHVMSIHRSLLVFP